MLCSNGSVSRSASSRALHVGRLTRHRRVATAPLDTKKVLAYECASRSMEAAKIYFVVFGLLTIAGGIVGYAKAGSAASIIAGSIAGVLLLVAAFLLPNHAIIGLMIAGIVSLLLVAQFIPKFLKTGRVMPAGLMSVLSVIGIIAVIFAWVKK